MNLGRETETLEFKKSTGELKEGIVSIGAILYYIVLQAALQLGLNTNDLKLVTALIVAVFLAIPYWKSKMFRRKVQPQSAKNGGNGHA